MWGESSFLLEPGPLEDIQQAWLQDAFPCFCPSREPTYSFCLSQILKNILTPAQAMLVIMNLILSIAELAGKFEKSHQNMFLKGTLDQKIKFNILQRKAKMNRFMRFKFILQPYILCWCFLRNVSSLHNMKRTFSNEIWSGNRRDHRNLKYQRIKEKRKRKKPDVRA